MACLTLTSCEKDNVLSPSPKAPLTKDKSMNNKSDGGVDEALTEFITSMYNEETIEYSLDAFTALSYTEATLYWRLCHPDAIPGVTRTYSLEFEVAMSNTADGWMIAGSDISNLNQVIYDKLAYIADTTQLVGVPNGTKFWKDVDIKIPTEPLEYSSTYTIVLNGILAGYGNPYSFGNCTFTDDWYGYHKGLCNMGGSSFVTSVMTAWLNDPNCTFYNKQTCQSSDFNYFYIPYLKDWKTSSGYHQLVNGTGTFPNTWLWYSYVVNGCVSDSYLNNTSIPGIISYANAGKMVHGYPGKILSYSVDRYVVNSIASHALSITYYAYCKKVARILPQGEPQYPRPEYQ